MTFREYLNTLFDFNIIEVNQNKPLPPYPFATFQNISENKYTEQSITSETINIDESVTNAKQKRIECIAQIDVYGRNYLEVNNTIDLIIDCCDFTYREELIENGFGIINISDISDNSSIEQTETLYRKTVEITYEYNEIIERTEVNAQSALFGTKDNPNSELVEREE